MPNFVAVRQFEQKMTLKILQVGEKEKEPIFVMFLFQFFSVFFIVFLIFSFYTKALGKI